jgi:hypothetical protein
VGGRGKYPGAAAPPKEKKEKKLVDRKVGT